MNTNLLFSSASDRWATPVDLKAALDAEFHFDFDPCPLDGEGDGLAPLFCEWKGKRVFCNPPYGPKLREWFLRGLEAALAVFLVPARTDTRWFHEVVLPNAKEVRFIKGRLKFGDAKNSAPFPSMIVIFEPPLTTGRQPIRKEVTMPKTKKRRATKKYECLPNECNVIQWGDNPTVNDKGECVCPKCGAAAELVIGIAGNPCFAHKIVRSKPRKSAREV